jgi:hypothetical protein
MDRFEAARVMGMKPSEVVEVEQYAGGVVVTTHDGVKSVLIDGQVLAYVPPPVEPEPVPDGDEVPDGSAKDVLAWVGDDPERALQAFEAEDVKESPRKVLLATLEKLVG